MPYDVTLITVHPGMHVNALPRLAEWLNTNPPTGEFLACLYSEIGALNQILLLRHYTNEKDLMAVRDGILHSGNPFGIVDLIAGLAMDTYVQFPFLDPIKPGQYGPFYEVRTYELKPDGLAPTIEAWRKSVPGRARLSPVLAAMYTVTGVVTRFMHIWPYATLEERLRIRTKAIETGVWPPPGGPDKLLTQQSDIFLPAAFSPMR